MCALLSGCLEGAFYYPDRNIYSTPDQRGLKYERVSFHSRDGTRLSGWFIPGLGAATGTAARATIIQFHGNAQNLSSHWEFMAWLPAQGFNVFVFDYRGYGESAGAPSVKGVFEDSQAALDHVRTRADVDAAKLVVVGQSLGGANAIAVLGAGNRAGVKAVVIDSAFASYSSIASDKFPGAGRLLDDTYSAERYVAAIAPVPLLLLHGTADRVIGHHHGRRLFEKAGEPKRFVSIPDGAHLDALSGRHGTRYHDMVLQFIELALAR